MTNDVSVQNSALGGCTCDVTLNSCDAYCCCDTDCSSEVRDYWNKNSNSFCAKNFVGSTFKPTQKCIDKGQIYNFNQRMGMLVTETEDKLCVELDSGTSQMDYLPYISSFEGTPSSLAYSIADTLTSPKPLVS